LREVAQQRFVDLSGLAQRSRALAALAVAALPSR